MESLYISRSEYGVYAVPAGLARFIAEPATVPYWTPFNHVFAGGPLPPL